MSTANPKKHKRFIVGELPIIHSIMKRMKLKEILCEYIPVHGNEVIPAVESLMLLIYNLTIAKAPLYELEEWVKSLDSRCIGQENLPYGRFNDDRFGRALDKLYWADRASLMTKIILAFVKEFGIDLSQLHNDSTTVKAFGKIPGKTISGLVLKKGHSKDHRHDLRQLVFSLSISSDGAVPIHHKCYPGNLTDDKTHIETWNFLRQINRKPDFLYVADSKLCTDEQLHYIVNEGGRAITIIPETWGEVDSFKKILRNTVKAKKKIWKRQKPGSEVEYEYFSEFIGKHLTNKRGYRIHWIYSSEKKKRDRAGRDGLLRKVEQEFLDLNSRINKRNLKSKQEIGGAVNEIIKKYRAKTFFHVEIGEVLERFKKKIGKGRPSKNSTYKIQVNTIRTLSWSRNLNELKKEANLDGIFPLLCTDINLSAKEVLRAYKYQPKLEKRFNQFKSYHKAAPLLFKKIERVEANMFVFFIALVIQALIEREIRLKMKDLKMKSLGLYPEEREALHPTTSKVFDRFEGNSTYQIIENDVVIEEYRDDLTEIQLKILELLNIMPEQYWSAS